MKEQFSRLFGLSEQRIPQEEVRQIPIQEIDASPFQPRTIFDDDRIEELCQTIKTHGVIQPIVVRMRNGRYEIIAGNVAGVLLLSLVTIRSLVLFVNSTIHKQLPLL